MTPLAVSLLVLLAAAPATPRETTAEGFETLMTRLADAWSKQDTRRALACFTGDALYMQPPDLQLYRGAAELEKLFRGIQSGTVMAFHRLAFDPRTQIGFGEFSFGKPTAAKADHGVVVITVRDGRIAVWREYFQQGPAAFSDFVAVEGKTWKWTGDDLK